MDGPGLTVVIADDHVPTRLGVRAALEDASFRIVGEASNAAAAVQSALTERPDVCLLDVHMPGSGVKAADEIGRQLPDCAVVMLTHSRDDDDLFDSLRAGARGYLLKDMNPDRIGNALRGVLAGEAALPRSLVARVLDEFQSRPRRKLFVRSQKPAALTSREWEVMELLREGLSTEEVAQRMFVAPGTVRVHVSSVLRKLRVKDRESALEMLDDREDVPAPTGARRTRAAS